MSTLSDLQKKLQQESEGIMFPFSTAVKKQTTQPVLDTTTDSIMSKTKKVAVQPIDPSEVYKGPAVIRYGAEGQRNLVEPDSGMLAGSPFKFSIDPITGMEKPLPKPGEGIVEDVTPAPTPPITTPAPDKITGNFALESNFAASSIAAAPPACLSNLTIGGKSISITCVQ